MLTHLGEGNNPTLAPDDRRIAFTLFPSAEAGAAGGVWMIGADGSDRHRVGGFGAPYWSPGQAELLINSFSLPTTSTLVNLESGEEVPVRVAGHQILSWPSWVDSGTLVTALTTKGKGDSIVLLDVHNPSAAKIIEVLWRRADLDVTRLAGHPTRNTAMHLRGSGSEAAGALHRGPGRIGPGQALEVVEYQRRCPRSSSAGSPSRRTAGISSSTPTVRDASSRGMKGHTGGTKYAAAERPWSIARGDPPLGSAMTHPRGSEPQRGAVVTILSRNPRDTAEPLRGPRNTSRGRWPIRQVISGVPHFSSSGSFTTCPVRADW